MVKWKTYRRRLDHKILPEIKKKKNSDNGKNRHEKKKKKKKKCNRIFTGEKLAQ